ncbi:hypothetical protein M758_6G144400 [Ceratodon purpureus]|nr:hypothetical protein M758_6G144400 [Ceratodon purpureus]
METQCTCCGFFWFSKKRDHGKSSSKPIVKRISKEHLLAYTSSNEERNASRVGRQAAKSLNYYNPPPNESENGSQEDGGKQTFEELRAAMRRANHGLPLVLPLLRAGVKETSHEFRSQDADGNKMVNEYVWKGKIGTGSYGKVVLYQSQKDEKLYAIKIFHKSRLCKLRVSPTETAMTDVLREVAIMKRLDHPNIVKLHEIIDDPQSDNMYLVLEFMEHNRIFEGCGPLGGIGEALAQKYFRDAAAGLSYLHGHNIVHGDIKPENLLLSGEGSIKICDFGVSRMFEGENDELRRSPGTPVYTAPECCSGSYYRGRPADVWALGCTLYCMVFGRYPFVGDGTFPSIYDEIVNQPLFIPEGTNPDLADLLRGLLCKDVRNRMPLAAVVTHPWLSRSFGQVQANGYKTTYVLQHPFPAGGRPSFENGSVELESMV